jgi:DNA-binding transcriptional ArsR family regulator
MSEPAHPPAAAAVLGGETVVFAAPPPPPTVWTADKLFAALGDPVRRRILLILSDGKPRTASELKISAKRELDATLKHLVALRAGGLVVRQKNAADGRRQLYTLAPGATARSTAAGGREIDFGPCVVRL